MSIYRHWAVAVGVCLGVSHPAWAQAPTDAIESTARFRVSVLENIPKGTYTVPIAINNAGQVLGWAFDDGACNPLGCGAVWTDLKPAVLGTVPHALFTRPVAFNDHGRSVGLIYFPGTEASAMTPDVGIHYPFKAVVWNGTEPTLLPSLPAGWSAAATAINNAGEIVGYSNKETVGQRGLVWHGTTPEYLSPCTYGPLINDQGQIVCSTYTDPVVFLSGGTVTILPLLGGDDGSASAINDSGHIVGSSVSRAGVSRATFWHQDKIGVLHSAHTESSFANADAINSRGTIVGYATSASGRQYAALWPDAASEPIDLNGAIGASDAAKFTLSEAVGINDSCEIAVAGTDNRDGTQQSYLLTLMDDADCGP